MRAQVIDSIEKGLSQNPAKRHRLSQIQTAKDPLPWNVPGDKIAATCSAELAVFSL